MSVSSILRGAAMALVLASAPAAAQSLADIDKAREAVAAIWEKTPLTQRVVAFVDKSPDNFGSYSERPTSVFKAGEPLVTYVEPVGYSWTPDGKGGYTFGFDVDFIVRTAGGTVLGGQNKFMSVSKSSRARLQEFMLTLTLTLTGIEPGDYAVEYTLHDLGGAKTSTFAQTFSIGD